jgi:hypothetical protein
MPASLSSSLSQVLVAFAIEFDNEFELQLQRTYARPFLTSIVMWSNVMQYVPENGVSIEEVACRGRLLTKPLTSLVGGLERWGYLSVDEDPRDGFVSPRPGFGSARGLKATSVLFPSMTGELAQRLWAPLVPEVEQRWTERLGDESVEHLREALASVLGSVGLLMPTFLPVVSGKGLFASPMVDLGEGEPDGDRDLPTLLSRVLLSFTLDYERDAAVSLPIAANALRVVTPEPVGVDDLPAAAGVSKEAVSTALTWLNGHGLVDVGSKSSGRGKAALLTAAGSEAQAAHGHRLSAVEEDWEARFGTGTIDSMRSALDAVLTHDAFNAALVTPENGWRGKGRYQKLTARFIESPTDALPRHPMILHRGGWPDGS